MQVKSASNLADALAIMVKASSINSMDAAGITSFMQSSDEDDDSESGAPDAAVYESHSGGISSMQPLELKLRTRTTSINSSSLLRMRLNMPTRTWMMPRKVWLRAMRSKHPLRATWKSPTRTLLRTARFLATFTWIA